MTYALFGLMLTTASVAGEAKLALRLEMPKAIRVGEPFTAVFTVSNIGGQGIYFKRPWKWASNGMRLEAVDAAGTRFVSSTALYDIARESVCTNFKAVGPEESYSFKELLQGVEREEPMPALQLAKGRYNVRWIYDVRHYDEDDRCATGGWRVFRGQASSAAVTIVVE